MKLALQRGVRGQEIKQSLKGLFTCKKQDFLYFRKRKEEGKTYCLYEQRYSDWKGSDTYGVRAKVYMLPKKVEEMVLFQDYRLDYREKGSKYWNSFYLGETLEEQGLSIKGIIPYFQ